jgi:hypothetical protein
MVAPADLEALLREELREPVALLVRRLVPELPERGDWALKLPHPTEAGA